MTDEKTDEVTNQEWQAAEERATRTADVIECAGEAALAALARGDQIAVRRACGDAAAELAGFRFADVNALPELEQERMRRHIVDLLGVAVGY